MFRPSLALFAFSAGLVASSLSAQSTSAFPSTAHLGAIPPVATWAVDKTDEHCSLIAWGPVSGRTLGFALSRPATSNEYVLAVFEKATPPSSDVPLQRALRITSEKGEILTLVGATGRDWEGFEWTTVKLSSEQVDKLIGSTSIVVSVGNQPPISVALAGSNLLPKLHDCSGLQLTRLGLNPELLDKIARWPEPNAPLTSLFVSDDYPKEAMAAGAQGLVGIRLDIDEQGRKLSCSVVKSSGNASLDSKTCAVAMSRGTLRAAVDKSGSSIAAPYITSVGWRLQAR